MSNNKNNLNKAMFDMFGVGKAPEQEKKAEAAPAKEAAAVKTEAAPAPAAAPAPVQPAAPVKTETPAPATYIAAGVVIEGSIRAKGDVEISGQLKGDITSEGAVTVRSTSVENISACTIKLIDCKVNGNLTATGDIFVTEDCVVNGNINGKSLSCSGKVNGDIVVTENFSLDSSACVVGKITTGSMIVARGAVIKGSIEMRTND